MFIYYMLGPQWSVGTEVERKFRKEVSYLSIIFGINSIYALGNPFQKQEAEVIFLSITLAGIISNVK